MCMDVTSKVRRQIDGPSSGMPNAPASHFCVVGVSCRAHGRLLGELAITHYLE